jgi:tetratricopeptide (TPR) repeat protein
MKTQKSSLSFRRAVLVAALVSTTSFMGAPGFAAEQLPAKAQTAKALNVWGDYLAGHHAEAVGDNLKALDYYAAVTRKGLTNEADIYSRSYILGLTEGRIDDALKALDKAEKLGGKAPLANLTRAVIALRDGDFTGAEVLLTTDDAGISQILSPVLIAWAKVGRKDFNGAIKALNKMPHAAAGGDDALSPLHHLHNALIDELAGRKKDATAFYKQLQKTAKLSVRSAELVGQGLERSGLTDDARKVYESLGNDAESLILIENMQARLKAKTPPALDVDTAQKGAAEALSGVAAAMLSQNAWESAMALAHMAEALRPNLPAATMVTATALEQSARRKEADALYAKLPENSPFSWMARLHEAENLDRLDKTDEAIRLLKTMSAERVTLSRPLIELGDVLRRHERFKEAADAYTEALKRIPKPGVGQWSVFYARGVSYEQSNQWPKAEKDFLRALELSPDQPLVLNYLGYLWIDRGHNLKRALAMISKAVEMRPRDGSIIDSLGWGLYRTGDFEGAVRQLEKATMRMPADPVINDHLGDALWKVGRTREARFQWQRVLNMEPAPELKATIEKKLESGLTASNP